MSAIKLCRKISKTRFKFLRKIYSVLLRVLYSAEFSSRCQLGRDVILSHNALGCVLSAKQIGDGCMIFQNVTLGAKGGGKGGSPTIGNNTIIYTGAVVIGDIHIGNNVIVAANAVVINDVPDNCIVGGVPARIIKYRDNVEEK